MIYILDKNKNPLMPTERHGKIRKLLNEGKAKVVKQIPFTIQLLYDSTEFTQPVTLGVDSGNIHVGLSAVANNKELYSGEHVLRTGKNSVHELLESRKTLRRSRRNRKTRYRKPRFENRARKPVDGFDKWYTPTTRCQIKGHIHAIDNITKIIPITDIIVECGAFDTQLLQNPDISGVQYQQGEMSDWDANLREYILYRDNHTCQWCKKNSFKDKVILETHHIQFRSRGGSNRANNLITLCVKCHKKFHKTEKETGIMPVDFTKSRSFANEAHMSTMRWALYSYMKENYSNLNINMTFGYKTKKTRIDANRQLGLNLEKSSPIDARCITGSPAAKPLGYTYVSNQRRCHDRSLFDAVPVKIPKTINPEGLIKNNSYFRPHKVRLDTHGFRDGDIIKVENDLYMIIQRQYYKTRATLHLKPWNNSTGTKKSIANSKAKLIMRNPDRTSIVPTTSLSYDMLNSSQLH